MCSHSSAPSYFRMEGTIVRWKNKRQQKFRKKVNARKKRNSVITFTWRSRGSTRVIFNPLYYHLSILSPQVSIHERQKSPLILKKQCINLFSRNWKSRWVHVFTPTVTLTISWYLIHFVSSPPPERFPHSLLPAKTTALSQYSCQNLLKIH